MAIPEGYICRDFGRPGCCSVPDPRYTMRFDDIGELPVYWCTHCGSEAMAINEILETAFKSRPGFAEDFKKAIETGEVKEQRDRAALDSPVDPSERTPG